MAAFVKHSEKPVGCVALLDSTCLSISNTLPARERNAASSVYMLFFFWIHAATCRPHETGTQSEPAM